MMIPIPKRTADALARAHECLDRAAPGALDSRNKTAEIWQTPSNPKSTTRTQVGATEPEALLPRQAETWSTPPAGGGGSVVDVLVLWKHNGRHFSIAKLAEAMRTVARRLHGVRFEEVIIVPVETTQPQKPKATPLVNGEPEFTFETSPAPAPKSGAGPKNPALVSLIAKLDKAPVGARIEVRKYLPDMPPRTIGMTLAALKRNKAVQGVIGYRDGLGRYILKREAESKK